MRYSATVERGDVVLRDTETGASARVDSSRGSNVVSFRTTAGGTVREILAPRGIPILFPFPNRIPDGRFTWRGRDFTFDVNERGRSNHNHGLVRDKPWSVSALGATDGRAHVTCTIELTAFPDVVRQYPFRCRLSVTVTLEDGALRHDATVHAGEPLPMGYGIHPWFPAALHGARSDTEVLVPATGYWQLKENIPTGQILPAAGKYDLRSWTRLGDEAYDDVFTNISHRPDGWSAAALRFPSDRVELLLEADHAYREWVLFAPTSQSVIAIEPYTCVTNAPNLHAQGIDAGLVELEAGDSWRARFRLSARASE